MRLNLFQFDTEQAAIDDHVVSAWYMPPDLPPSDPDYQPGTWQGGDFFPDEGAWLNNEPASGWWCIIGSEDAGLAEHGNCRLAWDNVSAVVLGGTLTGNEIGILWIEPVPSGAYNPWPDVAPPPAPE